MKNRFLCTFYQIVFVGCCQQGTLITILHAGANEAAENSHAINYEWNSFKFKASVFSFAAARC